MGDRKFVVELIKPSHYDDDGYVIQWWKSWIPSNSLACLFGIATELAARRAFGPDIAIEIGAYDECHTVIPVGRIVRRIKSADAGLVDTHVRLAALYLRLHRIRRRVERDRRPYADPALGLAADEPASRTRNKQPVAAAA